MVQRSEKVTEKRLGQPPENAALGSESDLIIAQADAANQQFQAIAEKEAADALKRADELRKKASPQQADELAKTEERARAAEQNLLHQLDAVERELEKATKKQKDARGLMAQVIGATVRDESDIRAQEIVHKDDIVPTYDEGEEKPPEQQRGFFGRLADRFAQADVNRWNASADLQEAQEKMHGKDGKSGVKDKFEALADDSTEKRVHALRLEKAKLQKQLREATHGMLSFIKREERWELVGETDAKEQEYNVARAELVADSLEAALNEQLGDVDTRSQVLNESQNALMDTLNTTIIGDNVTVRRAISMALSAGAVGAAATGFGAGALGLIGARRIFAGGLAAGSAYAGMAAFESRGLASKIKGESNAAGWRAKTAEYLRNVTPEDMKTLRDDEVADYLAHAQELAITRGIRPSSDPLVQSLFAESGRRAQERIKSLDVSRVGDAVESYLKDADARAEEAVNIVAADDTKRKLAAGLGAAFVASGAFSKVIGAIGDVVLPEANAAELDATEVARITNANEAAAGKGVVKTITREAAAKLAQEGIEARSYGFFNTKTGEHYQFLAGSSIDIELTGSGRLLFSEILPGTRMHFMPDGDSFADVMSSRNSLMPGEYDVNPSQTMSAQPPESRPPQKTPTTQPAAPDAAKPEPAAARAPESSSIERLAQTSLEAAKTGSVGVVTQDAARQLAADGYVIAQDGMSIIDVKGGTAISLPKDTRINIIYNHSNGYFFTETQANRDVFRYRAADIQDLLENRKVAIADGSANEPQPTVAQASTTDAEARAAAKKAQIDALRKEVDAEARNTTAAAQGAQDVEVRAQALANLQKQDVLSADAFKNMPRVEQYRDLIQAAADKYDLPPQLIAGVIMEESGGDPNAGSDAGAQGLMQLMPPTARYLGVTDPTNPAQSIDGGAKYLAEQMKRYEGNVQHALMAYNWGYGKVDKWIAAGSNPNDVPEETAKYIVRVLGHYNPQDGDFSAFSGDNVSQDTFQPRMAGAAPGVSPEPRSTGPERIFTKGDNETAPEPDRAYKPFKPITGNVLELKAEYQGLPFAAKVEIAFDHDRPDVEREAALRAILAKHGRAIYYKGGEVYLPQNMPEGAQRLDIFAYPDKVIVKINGVEITDFDELPELTMHKEVEVVDSSPETSDTAEIDPDARPLQEASFRDQKKSLQALVKANGDPRGKSFILPVDGGELILDGDGDLHFERPGGRTREIQDMDDLNSIPDLGQLLDAADPNSEVAQNRAELTAMFTKYGTPLGDTGTMIIALKNGDHLLQNTDGQMYYRPANGPRIQLVTADDYAKLPSDIVSQVVQRPPAVVPAQPSADPSPWDDEPSPAPASKATRLEPVPSNLDAVTGAVDQLPDLPKVPDITQVENPFRDPTPSEAAKKLALMAAESESLDDAPELDTEEQRFIDDIQDAITDALLKAEKARLEYEKAVAKDRSVAAQQIALNNYEQHVNTAKQLISAGKDPNNLNKAELAAVRSYGIYKPNESTGSRVLADAVAEAEAPSEGGVARAGRRTAKVFERMSLAIRNADDVINGATGNEQIIKGGLNAMAENYEERAQWLDEYAALAKNPLVKRWAEFRAEILRAKADHIDASTEDHLLAQDERAETRIEEDSFTDRRFGEGLRYTQTYAEFDRYNTPELREEAIQEILADNYERYVRKHVNTAFGPATRNTNSDYNTVTVWDGGPVQSLDVERGASSTVLGGVKDDVQNATAELRQPRNVVTPEDRLVQGLEDDAVRLYAAADRIIAIEDELELETDPAKRAVLEQQKAAVERFIVAGVQSIDRRYSAGGSGANVFRDSQDAGTLNRKQRIIMSCFERNREGPYRDTNSLNRREIDNLPAD